MGLKKWTRAIAFSPSTQAIPANVLHGNETLATRQ